MLDSKENKQGNGIESDKKGAVLDRATQKDSRER